MDVYYEKLMAKLQHALTTQREILETCAREIARCVDAGGIVHVFGTGHSHMLSEEMFYRAGGLAPVNAILEPALMLHQAAEMGTQLERMEGIAEYVFRRQDVRADDVLIACSNSGRNAAPIEMAMLARKHGAFTIGIGSSAYVEVSSRHSKGIKMADVVDAYLDNESDVGDASVPIGDSGLRVGATSTIVGAALLNDIVVRVAQILHEAGRELPFFISANGPSNQDDYNESLTKRFRARVRSF